jgi:hypothetical protein
MTIPSILYTISENLKSGIIGFAYDEAGNKYVINTNSNSLCTITEPSNGSFIQFNTSGIKLDRKSASSSSLVLVSAPDGVSDKELIPQYTHANLITDEHIVNCKQNYFTTINLIDN